MACPSGVPSLRGTGSLTDTPKQRSLLQGTQAPHGRRETRQERRGVFQRPWWGAVKVRGGDGFIKDGFPEEVGLQTGSEELKNEQECVRQDGKWEGCFGQRERHRHNGRGVSFVHFAGRALNGTLRHCSVSGGNP